MDIKAFFSYFMRRKWIIIGAFILCMVFSGIFTYFGANTYSSTQSIIIGPQTYASKDGKFVNNIVYVISDLINNERVAAELSKQTGKPFDTASLKAMASLTPVEQHQRIEVVVHGTDREAVAAAASRLPQIIGDVAADLFRVDNLIIEANENIGVSGKSYSRGLISGGVAGIGIGLLLVFVLLIFDDKIRQSRDIERLLGICYLGTLKRDKEGKQYNSDELSLLSSKLLIGMKQFKSKNIMNLNMGFSDGGTVYSIASRLASMNRKVLAVELDHSSDVLTSKIEGRHKAGFTDILYNADKAYGDAVYKTTVNNLYVMPAGSSDNLDISLLLDERFKSFMDVVGDDYDMVIYDLPYNIGYDKAVAFASQCPAAVLGVEAGSATMEKIEKVLDNIRGTDINVLGYYMV